MPNTELTHAYCTTDDLREQLSDLTAKKLSENQLNRAINAASRAVDEYTERRFWMDETPQTLLFEATPGDNELWLDQDIASTTGLAIATDTGGDGNYATVWDATDYRLWPYRANTAASLIRGWSKIESNGRLRWDVRATSGNRGVLPVQITGRFGWSSVPPQIEQATILKAAQLFKRKDSPYGVEQFGDIAAVQITRKDGDVVELLWPFVRDVAMVG